MLGVAAVQTRIMPDAVAPAGGRVRLSWLDGIKGISILWIVFFHFFGTYADGAYPWPLADHYLQPFMAQCAAASTAGTISCLLQAFVVGVGRVGFHAVAVFLLLSGFGLAYALAKAGGAANGWRQWYGKRLLRLFPMYWVAHLIYLVSPFVARPEAIDYRFVLSFLGERIYPIYSIFAYANPAWWYFGLLLQLYLVFPILYCALERFGTTWFLVVCAGCTFASRYVLLEVLYAHGAWVQGAFFGARLWEFAAGMVLGVWCARDTSGLLDWLFSPGALVGGVLVYTLGLYSYPSNLTYTFTDALIGTGLFVILAHLARWAERVPRLGTWLVYVGTYSYGLYLIHQPYVTYFGEQLRGISTPAFLVIAGAIIALLTTAAILIERSVNRLVNTLCRACDGGERHPAG